MTASATLELRAHPALANRRAFWGVMLSFLVHGLVVSSWVSRVASIKSLLHLGDGAFGLTLLGTAIGSVTAIPVCGLLVTRFGHRRAAKWTGIGFCLALLTPALAWNAVTLFAALLVYGALAGANDVAMNAQAVSTEKLISNPSMSRFHSMFSLGGIAGASLGGLIASLGVAPLEHLTAASLLLLGLAFFAPRLIPETHEQPGPKSRTSLRRVPAALLVLSGIGFCIFLSEGAIADWAGVYLKQVIGSTDAFAPIGYAAFSAAMAAFRFTGDAIVIRLGRASTIRLGGLIAALGMAVVVLAHSPWWTVAGFAAAGAGYSSIIPLVFAAGGRVKSIASGAGVATVSGIGYLGFLAGPPLIGFLSEITSLRGGLFLLVLLSAAAALLVPLADPLKDR